MIKVQLIVVQGKPEGKTIPLAGPVFRVGRDPSCHLRPSSDQVSRNHAEFIITKDSVLVKDLGSRNGTILNGRTLTAPAKLKSGDLVKIGHLTFAVSIQGAPAVSQEPTPRPVAATPPSLDEVPQETVEAWLIADDERPIPDRPSGVYDGETITIDAFKDSRTTSKPASSREIPVTPAPTAKSSPAEPPRLDREPKAAQSAPAPADGPSYLHGIEFEPISEGDAPAAPEEQPEANLDSDQDEEESQGSLEDEFMDESNPFYAARKNLATTTSSEAVKPAQKDSSDAARDILNRMLERRRNR